MEGLGGGGLRAGRWRGWGGGLRAGLRASDELPQAATRQAPGPVLNALQILSISPLTLN